MIVSCNKNPSCIFPLYFPLETYKASVNVSPITYKWIPQRQLCGKSSRIVELKRYEKNKMIRKKGSENLSRTILKIAERKSARVRLEINNSPFPFFLFGDGSASVIRGSSNVHGKKTDFSREHYHLSWRGLHRQCANYRFEPPARQVIKSQDSVALLLEFCLHFVLLIPRGEEGRRGLPARKHR